MFRIYSEHTVGKGSSVNSEEEVDTAELMSRENGPYVKEMEFVFSQPSWIQNSGNWGALTLSLGGTSNIRR